MSNRTKIKRKKLDPVQRRLNKIAEEVGEIERHLVLDPADHVMLRRAVALRDTLNQLYAMQAQQVQDILKLIASQYDADGIDAAIVDLGKGDDLGLIVWPKTEEQPSDPEPVPDQAEPEKEKEEVAA
jgi:hypothetical protein